jgi:HlyD family secretion protein
MIREIREIIGAVVLALSIGAVQGCKPADSKPDVPTLVVERSPTFSRRVAAEGTLQAVEATPVLAPQESKRPLKIVWLASDGSRVDEGEVVVRFDSTEMERELADSEDDVVAAQRKIGKVAVEGGAASRKREGTAELADAEVQIAEEFHSDDDHILPRHEILEGAIDIELARVRAEHARKVKTVERSVSSSELGLHRITRGQARREVDRAQEGLANLEVTAPHAGILVLARDWRGDTVRVGDTVWRGQKLAELPLANTLQGDVFVLEVDAGSLKEGLSAELVVEAQPGRVHAAKVQRIDTLAQPRHPDVPVHYFGVTLELGTTDTSTMRLGQRVRATILVDEDDVIVLPRQAVFERDGVSIVYRAQPDETFEPVEVELGSSSAGRVVISAGLEPGDVIALRDPTKTASELLPSAARESGGEGSLGDSP